MTKQEHELMLMMFIRVYEMVGIVTETLTSRGIWTDDDARAFSHATHADDKKLLHYATQARKDYLSAASLSGLTLGQVP